MTSPKYPARNGTKDRRVIRFIPGLWIEIFWHVGQSTWAAEMYRVFVVKTKSGETHEDWHEMGNTFQLGRRCFTRREAVRLLRVAVAERKDPKLTEVRRKLDEAPRKPTPQEVKAMNMGLLYGANPQRLNSLILGSTIV